MENNYIDISNEIKSKIGHENITGIIGSTSLHNNSSRVICESIGKILASKHEIALVTGGVPGAGETVGRAFSIERRRLGLNENLFHLLPIDYNPWDYGITLIAGKDMYERREILGRIANNYIMVEGGPGTKHEFETAANNKAMVIPVGATEGLAEEAFKLTKCPYGVPEKIWANIGDKQAPLSQILESLHYILQKVIG